MKQIAIIGAAVLILVPGLAHATPFQAPEAASTTSVSTESRAHRVMRVCRDSCSSTAR